MSLPASDTHAAFFYGTLMAPSVLFRVIYGTSSPPPYLRELTAHRPALLPSYQRHRVLHCDYPAITPRAGASVRGSLVTGLLTEDLRRLDVFEGIQYRREKVRVKVEVEEGDLIRLGEGMMEEAETYVWKGEPGLGQLEDQEWDFEEFKREKLGYWAGEIEWDDDGFGEVDEMVRKEEEEEEAEEQKKKNKMGGGKGKGDPMGGRAVNGKIGRELGELHGTTETTNGDENCEWGMTRRGKGDLIVS